MAGRKRSSWAATLGYDLDQQPIEMRTADLSFAGAAYPILYGREVKVLANRYAGIRFYDRLLHATGHALHYSMMNEPSFLLRANYAEPFDEGMAQVLALMLYRPEVNTKLFGLSEAQAAVMAQRYRLKSLFDLRDTMADSLFEFEAYADPDQDLSARQPHSRAVCRRAHARRSRMGLQPYVWLRSHLSPELRRGGDRGASDTTHHRQEIWIDIGQTCR